MQKAKGRWDVERAAAWLRSHAWGAADDGAAPPPEALVGEAVAEAGTELADPEQDEIDIAGWPALVAPFYD